MNDSTIGNEFVWINTALLRYLLASYWSIHYNIRLWLADIDTQDMTQHSLRIVVIRHQSYSSLSLDISIVIGGINQQFYDVDGQHLLHEWVLTFNSTRGHHNITQNGSFDTIFTVSSFLSKKVMNESHVRANWPSICISIFSLFWLTENDQVWLKLVCKYQKREARSWRFWKVLDFRL